MQNKKPDKKSEAIVGGIVVGGFGILWTIASASLMKDSPWPIMHVIFPCFGVLFVIGAIYNAVKIYNHGGQEEQEQEKESTNRDTELVNRIVGAVKEHQPQHKAEKWTCAYCGTVVDGEDTYCPSCGAGRK